MLPLNPDLHYLCNGRVSQHAAPELTVGGL
jgi:hypothetical protein